MPLPVYWTGPVRRCMISGDEFDGVLYDAKIPGGGWTEMNEATFKELGCELGVGKGQRYEKQEDGRWLLVAGGRPPIELSEADRNAITEEARSRGAS